MFKELSMKKHSRLRLDFPICLESIHNSKAVKNN